MSWRLTVVHSYSKKMLESCDNQIKKKGQGGGGPARDHRPVAAPRSMPRTRGFFLVPYHSFPKGA
jgi:hypothetical protein